MIFQSRRKSSRGLAAASWSAAVILALSLEPLPAADVIVRPLSGDDPVAGELVSLSADKVVVKTAGGEQSLPVQEVQAVEFETAASADKPSVWLELVDGSKLVAKSYLAAQGEATVELLGGSKVAAPTRSIRHVRFAEHTGELAEQWQVIVQGEPTSDLLVIRRKTIRALAGPDQEESPTIEVEALDELDGVVLEVTPESVRFEFGGERLDVKREKIDGIVYFHPVRRELPSAVCRVTDESRSVWAAKSIELKEGRLHLVTTAGVRADLPAERVAQLDFSSGNISYLGDLEPESTLEEGSFQPRNMTATFKQLKAPKWITGGSRRPFGEGLSIDGQRFTRGLALSSRTRLSYRVPEGMTRFRTMAGLDDVAGPAADLTLVILADNREVFRQSFTAGGERQAVPIDLEVGTAGRWTIVVDDGSGLDIADQLDLAEARFTK